MRSCIKTCIRALAPAAVFFVAVAWTTAALHAQTSLQANPNQNQLEAAIYQYFEGVQSLDPQRYASAFAPNGTLEDPGGSGPVTGRTAIAAAYGSGLTVLGRITPRVKDMFVGIGNSTEVTLRWELIAYTKAGKQVIVEGIGIFKYAPIIPGQTMQLESVREFYDPIQFSSQLQ
jgi:SnoaL-like domain